MNPDSSLTDPLVDADWVAAHLADESVRVIEVDVASTAYERGHIPGALLWNIYRDLRRPDYSSVSTGELEGVFARSGIDRETTAVFYGYGAHLGFWLMRSHGHGRARLLDGPREQWLDGGPSWSDEEQAPRPSVYPATIADPRLSSTRRAVLAMLDEPGTVVLDVRSQAEYDGERFWPSGATEGAGRAGHIPGSVHLSIESLRDPSGRFKDAGEMQHALLSAGITPEHRIVTYCTIGNRAAQAWFALSYLLDYPDVSVYRGSWAEWGLLPDTPIETSPAERTRVIAY